MSKTPAVLIMAKAPRVGRVKTRLEPILGRPECARLQSLLIRRGAELAVAFSPDNTFISFDPPDARQEMTDLIPRGVRIFPQIGYHLGERLSTASTEVFNAHQGPLLIIGTDIPTLTTDHLRKAADLLSQEKDVVFGPAVDGGYYLVGMHKPQPKLFEIEASAWGGPTVLALSLKAAHRSGIGVGLLETLHDLDTPEDAKTLCSDTASAPSDITKLLARALESTSEGTFGAHR